MSGRSAPNAQGMSTLPPAPQLEGSIQNWRDHRRTTVRWGARWRRRGESHFDTYAFRRFAYPRRIRSGQQQYRPTQGCGVRRNPLILAPRLYVLVAVHWAKHGLFLLPPRVGFLHHTGLNLHASRTRAERSDSQVLSGSDPASRARCVWRSPSAWPVTHNAQAPVSLRA